MMVNQHEPRNGLVLRDVDLKFVGLLEAAVMQLMVYIRYIDVVVLQQCPPLSSTNSRRHALIGWLSAAGMPSRRIRCSAYSVCSKPSFMRLM